MRKGYITAEEFVNQLNSDPEYVARMEEGNRKWQEMVNARLEALRPFREEVRAYGVDVLTPEELRNVRPLRQELVAILLKWLLKPDLDQNLYHSVLIGLHKPENAFDGTPLVQFWNGIVSDDPRDDLRWNVAYTIAESKPTGITDWVIERLKDPTSGTAREWFAIAIRRMATPVIARQALREVFADVPVDAAKGLAFCGTADDLVFLKNGLHTVSGKTRKEVKRAITRLEKRLSKKKS